MSRVSASHTLRQGFVPCGQSFKALLGTPLYSLVLEYQADAFLITKRVGKKLLEKHAFVTDAAMNFRPSFASKANACHASGLTIAQLLGHAISTQILPTHVKLLDKNTKAVIVALDNARVGQSARSSAIQ